MNSGNFLISIFLGITVSFPLIAQNVTDPSDEVPPRPSPPTHIPPPPPNLRPPSKAPTAPPPPRVSTKPKETVSPNQVEAPGKPDSTILEARQMTLEEILSLPPEQLIKIRDTIDKLAKLSPEEKVELQKRIDELEKLEESKKKKKREQYLARRREFNKQARILLWELMSPEEKESAQKVIKAAEGKKARHQTTQEYVKRALKDPEFEKEVNERTRKALAAKAKENPAAPKAEK